jgi:16S rRNA (guanine966-N2)-methyltransferase
MAQRKHDYGQIISGTLRGRKIRFSLSKHLRPTRRMVREAVFSAVYSQLGSFEGLKVLDAFCGSGLIGLEFISRGAEFVDFVDSDRHNYYQFRENIKPFFAEVDDHFRFWHGKVHWMLEQGEEDKKWDVIWLDPPFSDLPRNLLLDVLEKQLGKAVVLHFDQSGVPLYQSIVEKMKDTYHLAYQKQFGVSIINILMLK